MIATRIESHEEFKIGLPAIDAEHAELMELCNVFLDDAHSGAPISVLTGHIERLIDQTRAHFEAEEKLLDRHNYPSLAGHRAEHERLLTQAETLRGRFCSLDDDDEARSVVFDTAQFLQTWLLDHIRCKDMPYRPFLMSLA